MQLGLLGHEINNQWKKSFTEYYFYPNPTELVRTHLPENEAWQLVAKPITGKTYASQPIIGQGFFYKNRTLISPKNGVISGKKMIEIKIKNLTSADVVGYQFKGQRFGKKAVITFNNSIGSFTINLEKKRKTELYIFINNEIALQYKIR
jgi:hypothetical protein